MPSHRPLTATPLAQIDVTRKDAPVSREFEDVYYSVDNGLQESREVFLKACGLPKRWQGREVFTLGELGFGTGLNFLAVWQLWRAHRPSPTARLHFVSIEGYPLCVQQLQELLSPWAELSDLTAQLVSKWPGRVKGLHRLELGDGVVLSLCHDDIEPAISQLNLQADGWFLDGFSPAKNPDMWAPEIMARLYELSAPDAHIGTFTVAGFVRRGLAAAGFKVAKRAGFGRKRERLEAIKPKQSVAAKPQGGPVMDPPIIIGGGIAGASLARSFLRRGIMPILIDANDDTAASGNPAASVKPRFDLQDRPTSRFFLTSYLYAVAAYGQIPGAVISRGTPHAARTDDEVTRFEKLAVQAALPTAHFTRASQAFIAQQTGLTPPRSGIWLPQALSIDPVKMRAAWTQGTDTRFAKAAKLERRCETQWRVLDEGGVVIAQGSHIFLANGEGLQNLLPQTELNLGHLRGQISWAEGVDSPLRGTYVYGGYAIRKGDKLIAGATHDHDYDIDPDMNPDALRAAGDRSNVDNFVAMGGHDFIPTHARSAVRMTTLNTLPLIGEVEAGLNVLTGLGGRGFTLAPLLAEHMVSRHMGEPWALSRAAHTWFSFKPA